MDTSRRRLLSALALSASFSGCLGRTPPAADGSGPTNTPTETTESATPSTTTTEPVSTETTMDDGTRATKRATGEPTSVERTVEDEDLEYLPETDEVRYVAAYRHTNHEEVENGSKPEREPVYETVPFDRWARTECLSIGAKGVNDALDERLDGETEGISAGFGRIDGESESRIGVWIETALNRAGEITATPSSGFEEVVAATPRTVEVTFSFAGEERTCTEPVFVREVTVQEE